jgi:Ca2+-binding EF-hand superfamily protein
VPLSDLLRRKLIRAYHVFDFNGSGTVQKADFDGIFNSLVQSRNWKPDQPEAQALRAYYDGQWAQIAKYDDGRGGVSVDEWLKAWETMLSDPAAADAMISAEAKTLFAAIDENADGKVTRDEARKWFKAYRLPPEMIDKVLESIGVRKFGTLSLEQATKLLRDFYQGNDPKAPGNMLYGPF